MTKFKRYIKNLFSIAGVEWRDGKNDTASDDGIVLSAPKISTSTDRSTIATQQYLISLENLSKNVLVPTILPLLDPTYNANVDPSSMVDKDVGNIPAGTLYSELNGKTVNYILDKIFFLDPPAILLPRNDSMSRNLPVEDVVEVGENLQFDVSIVHFRGFISSGDGSPVQEVVGDATKFDVTDFTGTVTNYVATSNGQNHIGDIAPALLGNNIIQCDISWEDGTDPYFWEDGSESFAFDQQRLAGNEIVTNTVIGNYNAFFGSGILASKPIDPAGIRALSSEFLSNIDPTELEITVPAGDVEFYFYVPDTYTVQDILHYKDANTFVGDNFVVAAVPMEDGSGAPIGYTEYVLDIGGIGFPQDAIYKINVTP